VAARYASEARIDLSDTVRRAIREAGYDHGPFNAEDCTVITSITEQPLDPERRRDERALDEEGLERLTAKHQATLFGYACRHTPGFLPVPIWLAHRLARRLDAVRADGTVPGLCPDAKTQVGVEYRAGVPRRVHSITLVTSQWQPDDPAPASLREAIQETVIAPVFADEGVVPDADTRLFVNPEGPAITGGPAMHSGLTGRKVAVDTYGEYARHSGNALSGKDPARIDRIGAYAARHAARAVVSAGLAEECEVLLSYSIGQAAPASVQVQTFGTGGDDEDLTRRVQGAFDFRPGAVIRRFDLRGHAARQGALFAPLAAYGQVGRTDLALPWEEDAADLLR
jgi:S-adenosylmethionine synthetase